jgi:hypothetical protein
MSYEKPNPKELLEKAEKNVEEKTEEFEKFSIGSYSIKNKMLIFMQCPEAKEIKGYRAWKAEGRQVQKGEHGIRIFAPLTRKDKENDDEVFGFRLVSVFDISQTKPMEEVEQNDKVTTTKSNQRQQQENYITA